jgi:hypothetical protein
MNALILAIFTVLMALPPSRHDTETRDERAGRMWVIAHAVATEAVTARQSAKVLVQIYEETKLDAAVHAGRCRPGTCDHNRKTGEFLARGLPQLHRNARNQADWDAMLGDSPEATQLQMRHAARMMRICADPVEMFEALGGGPCRKGPRGERRAALAVKVEGWLRDVYAGRKVTVVWK